MAGKIKPGIPVKGINIKLKMINDLMDVTGSAKDSWNPAEISDDMKAIAYIHDLADTWNPAQLNEALKYLGFATIDSWNPAIIEETKNNLVKYFLPTDASGNPIELDLKGLLPYEVTALTIGLLPIQPGTGDPAPDNVRPITGRDSVTLTVNTEDTTISLPETVYNGTVNVIEGGTTSNMRIIDLGNVNWSYYTGGTNPIFIGAIPTPKIYGTDATPNALSSIYYVGSNCNSRSALAQTLPDNSFSFISTYGDIVIRNSSYTDATTFKTAMLGVQLCYEVATPAELTTSDEEVTLVNGVNTLSTDGDTINITYKAILNS